MNLTTNTNLEDEESISGDVIVATLISDLSSPSSTPHTLLSAATRLRHLTKTQPHLRSLVAISDAAPSLLPLLSHPDPTLQEHAVTTILNLSLSPSNISTLTNHDVIPLLVHVLRTGTDAAQANAACAILRFSYTEDRRSQIVNSGAIPGLVRLMEMGSARGKKDAMTAMFMLCDKSRENKVRAVEAGVVRVLVELVEEGEAGVAVKAVYLVWGLVGVEEGRRKVVEEGGVGVMVDVVELGTRTEKKIAVEVLLGMCEASGEYCGLVANEGVVPSLIALLESGKLESTHKVEKLIEMLRNVKFNSRELET